MCIGTPCPSTRTKQKAASRSPSESEAPLDTLLFAMRVLHFTATISTGGVIVFRQVVVASSFPDASFERTLRRIFAMGILILLASGIGWSAVTAAAIADEPIEDVFAGPLASEVLLDTQFGQVSLLRQEVLLHLIAAGLGGGAREDGDRVVKFIPAVRRAEISPFADVIEAKLRNERPVPGKRL